MILSDTRKVWKKMKDTLNLAIIPGMFGLVGIIFFIIGIFLIINRKKKEKNCTSKTYGKVIDIVKVRYNDVGKGYSYMWHPVFEYNIGNQKLIKQSAYGKVKCNYAIGQNVEIYFNPENYNEYYVAGENIPITLGIIFTCVGIVALIMAFFSIILMLVSSLGMWNKTITTVLQCN